MDLIQSPLVPDGRVEKIDELSIRVLHDAWRAQLGIELENDRSDDSIVLFRCVQSRLRFFSPGRSVGGFDFYERLQKFAWYYLQEKWEYTRALDMLPSSGRLLDVGCGEGAFLRLAVKRGLRAEGLEMNPAAAREGAARGLNIRVEDLKQRHSAIGEGYDVVTSFQVLEHVERPSTFLGDLVKLVRPGGLLVLGVPHSDGCLANSGSVLEWPPHHQTQWNESSLAYLSQMLPIDLLHLQVEPLQERHLKGFTSAQMYPCRRPDIQRRLTLLEKVALRAGVWSLKGPCRARLLPGLVLLAAYVRRSI